MPAVNNLPLLMTDSLPLRRVTELPKYRTDTAGVYLPWVFGRATLAAIPLDAEGVEWLVADHPIVGVDKVVVAGKETSGWQLQQRLDETGKAVSVVRLTQPSQSGPVAVSVVGRKHPVTGALLTTPGDIVREIMRLCKHVEPNDAWAGLNESYGQVELGLVFTAPEPLRSAIASVIEPLNAIWRPGWAAPKQPGTPTMTLSNENCETVSARMDNTTLATSVRVAYNYDWASGAPRGTLVLNAPEAQERWGELVLDLELPTVRKARDALTFASARLADGARATWTVTASVEARVGKVLAGDTVKMDHPHAPTGLAIVTAVAHDREESMLQITATMHTESSPVVVMARRNSAVDLSSPSDPVTSYRDGVATFTIYDESGEPLANASVTLDSMYTSSTDATGKVQFKTPRGPHTLLVEASGFASFEMDVDV